MSTDTSTSTGSIAGSNTAAGTGPRGWTEVEEALVDAQIDAHYSALAHDGDPRPARRVDELEALQDLRPLPEPQPEHENEREQEQEEPGHEELELELDEDEEPEL